MDLTQLANLGEFIGGIAVLVTLIYLAFQVRQGTSAALSTNHAAMAADLRSMHRAIAEDPSLAELMLRAESNPRDLSQVDARRFEEIARCQFALWEQAFHCRQQGTIDETTWIGWDEFGREKYASPGHRIVWKEIRLGYFELFRDHLEREIFTAPTASDG